MKVIEFIKRNISVFSVVNFIFLIYILFIQFFSSEATGCAKGWLFLGKFFLIFCICFLFTLDFILKKLLKNRLYLNFLQLLILVLIYIYYSFYI